MSIHKPTDKDILYMQKAIDEAQTAIDNGKVGVGALLLLDDEILTVNHNSFVETQDMINHAEIVALHAVGPRLSQMSEQERGRITIYTTLEPCLMCLSAIVFMGIKRVAYSALVEDANSESLIARGLTADDINMRFVKGPLELIPGVLREQGKSLLAQMDKEA